MQTRLCLLAICCAAVFGCSQSESKHVTEMAKAPWTPVASAPPMGPNSRRNHADLRDRTSNTIIIGERAAGAMLPADEVQPLDQFNTEAYDHLVDNGFQTVAQNPLSTFSIDVDTASYSLVRRFLQSEGRLPPPGAVRIEELINYFSYSYPQPVDGKSFSVNVEMAACPWNGEHRLVRIGLKGREIPQDQRTPANLVFLLDVSGSMNHPQKLPLVKAGMKLLLEQLTENDHVSIVTYAGASGVALPSTPASQKLKIAKAIESLQPGGSTNGAQGIELAYQLAEQNRIPKGTNRVILCTDGDFNVGVTSQDELVRLIEGKAKSGVFLSVLGFGMGNYKDSTLEKLADKGNGNYAYIDTYREAKKVLVEQMQGTLITIAKDVKIQIEFNPAKAAGYRLIGYENRLLAKEDFNNDQKDAGDIGAGHTVTALYEVIPAGKSVPTSSVDPLKYQPAAAQTKSPAATTNTQSDELMTVKLRYKQPEEAQSTLLDVPVKDVDRKFAQASPDFVWAASVAAFGMLLRQSEHKGNITYSAILEMAQTARGQDSGGYREEFIGLVRSAVPLQGVATR